MTIYGTADVIYGNHDFQLPSGGTLPRPARSRKTRDHARFAVSVSDVVLEEAEKGDRRAAKKRLAFLAQFPVLVATPDVQRLTEWYLQERIVPLEKPGDAAHLAFASVYQMEFLCTWNFKHLANAFTLKRLRGLNEKQGLFTPQVCTPEELLGE